MYKRITITLSDEDLIKPIAIPFSFNESRKICSELTPYDFKREVQIAIAGADYIDFSVNKIFGYIFVAEKLTHPYSEKPIWGFTDEWKKNYIPPFPEEQILELKDLLRSIDDKPLFMGIDLAKDQDGN